jgi:hypothetical protein
VYVAKKHRIPYASARKIIMNYLELKGSKVLESQGRSQEHIDKVLISSEVSENLNRHNQASNSLKNEGTQSQIIILKPIPIVSPQIRINLDPEVYYWVVPCYQMGTYSQ